MKIVKSKKVMLLALFMSLPSVSFAITSCWQTADPIGCGLQCAFAGHPPCPYDNSSISNSTAQISLPSVSSKEYKKVKRSMEKQIKSVTESSFKKNKTAIKRKPKIHLKQICSKSELLSAVDKYRDPNKVKNVCFKEISKIDRKMGTMKMRKPIAK